MKQRAFTLMEVMIALLLGSLAVLLAHATFTAATDFGSRVAAGVHLREMRHNGSRLLRSAIGDMEVGSSANAQFDGGPKAVSFGTWLISGSGIPQRQRLVLRLDEASRWLVITEYPDTIVLAENVDSLLFDYLLGLGAQAPWMREWQSPVTAPRAIRIRIWAHDARTKADTLLFAVGTRG